MKWQRLAAPALVAILAGACSGDGSPDQVAAPDLAASSNAEPDSTTSAPTTTATKPTTTTRAAGSDAPNSLAFASSSDIGRLFELAGSRGSIPAYETARADADSVALNGGDLVQAANARSVDGSVWVLVVEPVGERSTLGWVPVEYLLPTDRSIIDENPELVGEFRRVSTTVRDDLLSIYSSPGAGSIVGHLTETSIAMHGGSSAMIATGETWVDVLDPATRSRIGWVVASDFASLRNIEAKNADGSDVARRAERGVSYGASLRTGSVTAVGCNASQISFTTASGGLGTAILFGTSEPTGQASRSSGSVFRWSSSDGSTVYAEPGHTVTFTFPTNGPKTWYFAALDGNFQAESARNADGNPVVDPNGKAIVTNAQSVFLDGGSCVYVPPVEEEETGLNPYILDLPPDERDAAIADFEASQGAAPGEEPLAEDPDSETTTTTVAPA